jgi:hypothetical protein
MDSILNRIPDFLEMPNISNSLLQKFQELKDLKLDDLVAILWIWHSKRSVKRHFQKAGNMNYNAYFYIVMCSVTRHGVRIGSGVIWLL